MAKSIVSRIKTNFIEWLAAFKLWISNAIKAIRSIISKNKPEPSPPETEEPESSSSHQEQPVGLQTEQNTTDTQKSSENPVERSEELPPKPPTPETTPKSITSPEPISNEAQIQKSIAQKKQRFLEILTTKKPTYSEFSQIIWKEYQTLDLSHEVFHNEVEKPTIEAFFSDLKQKYSANPNILNEPDEEGTPLMWAIRRQNLEAVKWILEGDPNTLLYITPTKETTLVRAIDAYHPEILKTVLRTLRTLDSSEIHKIYFMTDEKNKSFAKLVDQYKSDLRRDKEVYQLLEEISSIAQTQAENIADMDRREREIEAAKEREALAKIQKEIQKQPAAPVLPSGGSQGTVPDSPPQTSESAENKALKPNK